MTEQERRFLELRKATAEMLARMTPAQRDEILQLHLAEAMGPKGRFRALVSMTTAMMELRKHNRGLREGLLVEEPDH